MSSEHIKSPQKASESKVPFSQSNDEEQDKLLLEPMLYLLEAPGKNVRKKMLQAFNFWTKIPPEKVQAIGELVQMLHNASLLLDDIQDNSILRRGKPVAHKIYGNNFYLFIVDGAESIFTKTCLTYLSYPKREN